MIQNCEMSNTTHTYTYLFHNKQRVGTQCTKIHTFIDILKNSRQNRP